MPLNQSSIDLTISGFRFGFGKVLSMVSPTLFPYVSRSIIINRHQPTRASAVGRYLPCQNPAQEIKHWIIFDWYCFSYYEWGVHPIIIKYKTFCPASPGKIQKINASAIRAENKIFKPQCGISIITKTSLVSGGISSSSSPLSPALPAKCRTTSTTIEAFCYPVIDTCLDKKTCANKLLKRWEFQTYQLSGSDQKWYGCSQLE